MENKAERAKPTFADILETRRFNHTTHVIPDKVYFTIQENIIGTATNFVALTGLPKTSKSTIISAFIASFITGRAVLDFKLQAHEDKFKIALFDTEQSAYDFSRSVTRIQKFTGYDTAGIFQFFDAFLCREDNSQNILRLIDTYLNQTPNLAILIIDGLLDLIDSMNDETASKRLITTLKRWGKKHNILIITVLHLGKKDQSSIGHIGSASDRYAQSTLLVEKTKNGTFTCSPKFLRSAKDFNTIEIQYSDISKNFIQVANF
jgi:hypothetical protein